MQKKDDDEIFCMHINGSKIVIRTVLFNGFMWPSLLKFVALDPPLRHAETFLLQTALNPDFHNLGLANFFSQ